MNDDPKHDLEDLLANARYVPPKGFESRLQAKLDGLVNQHGESVAARLSALPTEAERRALVSKRRVNVLALAVVVAGIAIVGLILILPTLPGPQPAAPSNQATGPTAETADPTQPSVPLATPALELQPGELVELPLMDLNTIADLAFSPDGEVLAVATAYHGVILWDLLASQFLDTVYVYSRPDPTSPNIVQHGFLTQVAFSPDGRLAVAGTYDGTVTVLRDARATQMFRLELTSTAVSVNDLAFSGDGSRLIAGYEAGEVPTAIEGNFILGESVVVWDMTLVDQIGTHSSESAYAAWKQYTVSARSVAVSPDGSRYAAGSADGTVNVFTELGEYPPHSTFRFFDPRLSVEVQQGISSLSFRTDREYVYLLVGTENGSLYQYGLGDGSYQPSIMMSDGLTSSPQIAIYSPDGMFNARIGDQTTVVITQTSNHRPITVTIPEDAVAASSYISSLAFHPNNMILAIGMSDGSVWLWRWR